MILLLIVEQLLSSWPVWFEMMFPQVVSWSLCTKFVLGVLSLCSMIRACAVGISVPFFPSTLKSVLYLMWCFLVDQFLFTVSKLWTFQWTHPFSTSGGHWLPVPVLSSILGDELALPSSHRASAVTMPSQPEWPHPLSARIVFLVALTSLLWRWLKECTAWKDPGKVQ